MCTSILMKSEKTYFGRNMDLHYPLEMNVIITPRKYTFPFRKSGEVNEHLAMIGMGMVRDGYPLYFEASNEYGLAMAGLNFPDNAHYSAEADDEKSNISPFELIPWVIGGCKSVDDAQILLENTHICAIDFSLDMPLSPLHWHIADGKRSITFEVTEKGQNIYENPVNVMTNNPTFDFHLQNLARYLNLTNVNKENCFSDVGIKPFSGGFGAIGLPGDFSSTSRFVKAAFLLANSNESTLAQYFHILDSVAMVKGSIKVEDRDDVTLYSCAIDLENSVYYYKTQKNNRICAVKMNGVQLDGNELFIYSADEAQDVFFKN